MPSLSDLLQPGAGSAWVFIPTAMVLGALHGLEPGHSKTMMAAFIIAVRGTIGQAILLGISATFSHTLIVWLVALAGLYLGDRWSADTADPYLHAASAALIIAVALWMLLRTWLERRRAANERHHRENPHGDGMRRIDTGHGLVTLEVFEKGMPPRWRLRVESGHFWPAKAVAVETRRVDDQVQLFTFADRGDYLESIDDIPEPHAFTARLKLHHGSHVHDHDVIFREHDHGHDHGHTQNHSHAGSDRRVDPNQVAPGLDVLDSGGHDAHEMAHADDIRRRFTSGHVTTSQIVAFGLTGGLLPCPAAITVLLLCLQVKQFALGIVLVLAFSIGLGVTMVTAGVIASVSVRHIASRWSGFGVLARRAPYFSSTLMLCVGLLVAAQGLAKSGSGDHHTHAVFWPFGGKP